jgi:hypothetical protein
VTNFPIYFITSLSRGFYHFLCVFAPKNPYFTLFIFTSISKGGILSFLAFLIASFTASSFASCEMGLAEETKDIEANSVRDFLSTSDFHGHISNSFGQEAAHIW